MVDIAKLIPAEFRKEILLQNHIQNAVAIQSSEPMYYLMVIWKEYVEPGIKITCNACYERVLKNYRQLEPVFIELEKQDNLLNNA